MTVCTQLIASKGFSQTCMLILQLFFKSTLFWIVISVNSISIQTALPITFYLLNTLCFCSLSELKMGAPLHWYGETDTWKMAEEFLTHAEIVHISLRSEMKFIPFCSIDLLAIICMFSCLFFSLFPDLQIAAHI